MLNSFDDWFERETLIEEGVRAAEKWYKEETGKHFSPIEEACVRNEIRRDLIDGNYKEINDEVPF